MILEVIIDKDMVDIARSKSYEMGKLRNSITKGDGNLAGFIGEAMVAKHIGASITNTYHYDLVYKSLTIDVKTKRTTVPPLPHYECSVADFNTQQNCHWYVFTRVSSDLSVNPVGWILGYIPKDEFYKRAKKHYEGELDTSNGFYFKADCYNIRIDQLYDLPADIFSDYK